MKILGISAFYHDSAAALVVDGKILAAAQEERFTRKKQDADFPKRAIEFCLAHAGLEIDQIDRVVFYDKPFLKFERLIETYYNYAPKGLRSFILSMPVWLKEKLFLKSLLLKELRQFGKINSSQLLFSEHHLSHAASAFYPSPFAEAAILTIDGVGEWATASICRGSNNQIEILRELHFPHSVGLFYSAFTYFLGFKVNSGEYKLMGLAPYGNPGAERTKKFVEVIKSHLVSIREDGSIALNQEYFDYATGLRMVPDKKWLELFGFGRREAEGEISQEHCDLALAAQLVTEEIVFAMAAEAKRLTNCKNLCLAGGVALNCVANGKLTSSGLFEEIWIQPAAGDAGGALGAALAATYLESDLVRPKVDQMQGSFLGPEFSQIEVERLMRRYSAQAASFSSFDLLCERTIELVTSGKVIGWFQGRMEWGPRSLGHRSILADARNPEMQKKLNLKIKYRESFRPFAPSVLIEESQKYFNFSKSSDYMLQVAPVADSIRMSLPEGFHDMDPREKLYYQRSTLPAITHLDYSARLQTVSQESNPAFYRLLLAMKAKTGIGVLVNTSFNVRGEPIVCTPEDAYKCFMRTEMDVLVLNNYLFLKEEQPEWTEGSEWQQEYTLD